MCHPAVPRQENGGGAWGPARPPSGSDAAKSAEAGRRGSQERVPGPHRLPSGRIAVCITFPTGYMMTQVQPYARSHSRVPGHWD